MRMIRPYCTFALASAIALAACEQSGGGSATTPDTAASDSGTLTGSDTGGGNSDVAPQPGDTTPAPDSSSGGGGTADAAIADGASGSDAAVASGCKTDADCPKDQFCDKPVTQCGGAGQCTAKPEICTKEMAPVCGCDGKPYSNPCAAKAAGVSVAQLGACGIPPVCDVASQAGCKPDEYCAAPTGLCAGPGSCAVKPQGCTADYSPVCGCDGKTYGNSCSAAAMGVHVAKAGECAAPGGTGCDVATQQGCAAGEFCKSASGLCYGTGSCAAKPEMCNEIYAPVCGCDGKDYSNACAAQGAGQNVLAKDKCVTGPQLKWFASCGDPVCKGYQSKGVPLCGKNQQEGGGCEFAGQLCDPLDGCNALRVCAAQDPKQMGGCPISKAAYKQAVQYVDAQQAQQLAERLLALKLATYQYKAQGPQGRRHLGFIIDDDPNSPAVDAQRDMVDLYGYLSMAVATLQTQQAQIDQLQAQVQTLTGQCGALPMSRR